MMEDREHQRVVVDKRVECKAHGVSAHVTLYNLSVSGCMIEFSSCFVMESDDVTVKLNDFIIVSGRVIWQVGRNAGIQFTNHLHEAVVKHLGFQPRKQNFEATWQLDRFGRPLPPLAPLR